MSDKVYDIVNVNLKLSVHSIYYILQKYRFELKLAIQQYLKLYH